jgi:hypothetical protein
MNTHLSNQCKTGHTKDEGKEGVKEKSKEGEYG